MFSGLTNQVSSWMGQVKGGENHDEEVPSPTVVQTSSEPLEQTQSPQQQHQNLLEPQEENVALGDEEEKRERFVTIFSVIFFTTKEFKFVINTVCFLSIYF